MRRSWIERSHSVLSISSQCALAGVNRSSWYYHPTRVESEQNLALMRLLDEQYTRTPFYGVRKMTKWLRDQGWHINPKRVRRLMRWMGLETIYPKPRLSKPAPGHRIYPYLLRGLVHCPESSRRYFGRLFADSFVVLPRKTPGIPASRASLTTKIHSELTPRTSRTAH